MQPGVNLLRDGLLVLLVPNVLHIHATSDDAVDLRQHLREAAMPTPELFQGHWRRLNFILVDPVERLLVEQPRVHAEDVPVGELRVVEHPFLHRLAVRLLDEHAEGDEQPPRNHLWMTAHELARRLHAEELGHPALPAQHRIAFLRDGRFPRAMQPDRLAVAQILARRHGPREDAIAVREEDVIRIRVAVGIELHDLHLLIAFLRLIADHHHLTESRAELVDGFERLAVPVRDLRVGLDEDVADQEARGGRFWRRFYCLRRTYRHCCRPLV